MTHKLSTHAFVDYAWLAPDGDLWFVAHYGGHSIAADAIVAELGWQADCYDGADALTVGGWLHISVGAFVYAYNGDGHDVTQAQRDTLCDMLASALLLARTADPQLAAQRDSAIDNIRALVAREDDAPEPVLAPIGLSYSSGPRNGYRREGD